MTNRNDLLTTAEGMDLSHIAEYLRSLAVPIIDLVLDPANARRHPQKNLERMRLTLTHSGPTRRR